MKSITPSHGLQKWLECASKPKQILICDDEHTICKSLRLWLAGFACEVCCVGSGPEAIEMVKSQDFDLVLLDLMMPEMSGTDVYRRIRMLCPALPVVIITGFPDEKIFEELRGSGVKTFLIKPDDFNKSKIEELCKMFNIKELRSTQAYR